VLTFFERPARRHGVTLPHQRLGPADFLMLEQRADGRAIPAARQLVDLQTGWCPAAAAREVEVQEHQSPAGPVPAMPSGEIIPSDQPRRHFAKSYPSCYPHAAPLA
jgi:hypothetical protein